VEARSGLLAADPWMNANPSEQAPRNLLKRMKAKAARERAATQEWCGVRVLLISPDGTSVRIPPIGKRSPATTSSGADGRRYDVISEILRRHAQLGWNHTRTTMRMRTASSR